MNDSKKKLEEIYEYCFDKAESAVDFEEVKFYISEATKVTNTLVELETKNADREFETRKYEESKDLLDVKFILELCVPVATQFGIRILENRYLQKYAMASLEFEKTGIVTSTFGKGFWNSIFRLKAFK